MLNKRQHVRQEKPAEQEEKETTAYFIFTKDGQLIRLDSGKTETALNAARKTQEQQ